METEMPRLNWVGKENPKNVAPVSTQTVIATKGPESAAQSTTLYHGENLGILAHLVTRFSGQFNLIYIDPPFDSKENYHRKTRLRGVISGTPAISNPVQYVDRWAPGQYLQFLYERLTMLNQLLHERGSILIHCDRHREHHIRCVADEVFGPTHFRGAIAWCYGGGGAAKRQYAAKHDVILWYSKSNEWTFNRQFRPYSEGTRQRGLTQVKGSSYSLNENGAMLNDWWADKPVQKILSPTARENPKYPTQKPLGLLERLIRGHSNPGDLVLDAFCGSGTTLEAARTLDRSVIGIDQNECAITTSLKRILRAQKKTKNGYGPIKPVSVKLQATSKSSLTTVPSSDVIAVEWGSALIIKDFIPTDIVKRCESSKVKLEDWRQLVDYILIDPNYDGDRFVPTLADIPERNALVAGTYEIPITSKAVMIWLVDVDGHAWPTVVLPESKQRSTAK